MTPPPEDDPLSSRRRDSVAAILRCTHEMLSHAREGEWDRLVELEEQRRPMIEAFFSTPPEPHEAPAVAEFIREVQEIDSQVMALAEEGKQATAEALRLLSNRQRAAHAYGDTRRR